MELFIALPIIVAYLAITIVAMNCSSRYVAETTQSKVWRRVVPLLVLLIAFAIPFGDHLVGWLHFNSLCKEAGTHIYRIVDGVPGLRWREATGETALRHGYSFVESGATKERVTRYIIEGNDVIVHKNALPISPYSVELKHGEPVGMRVIRQDFVISDDKTGELLASYTTFAYQGGWLIRAVLAGYGGTAASCPAKPIDVERLVTSVLRPAKRSK